MSDQVAAIQRALDAKGYAAGRDDGFFGQMTAAALRRFQHDAGLAESGLPDAASLAALLGPAAPADTPIVWFGEAERLLGLHERSGPGSNPAVLELARGLNIDYRSDDVPWCGLFVAHCVAATLPGEPLPTNPLLARNWTRFGRPTEPRLGAVMVFWRGDRNGSQGHVGFYAGEDPQTFRILGGNQSDSVCYTRVPKARLLGARWPASAASILSRPLEVAATDASVSANEA